jgi:ERCC4-type nuclease
MWRLPLLHASTPEDSLRIVRFLADQARRGGAVALRRYDRKPRRISTRKLFMLQGLPGVGPSLAHRLLLQFGSIEKVVTASESELIRVRGVGPMKAVRIRELLGAD